MKTGKADAERVVGSETKEGRKKGKWDSISKASVSNLGLATFKGFSSFSSSASAKCWLTFSNKTTIASFHIHSRSSLINHCTIWHCAVRGSCTRNKTHKQKEMRRAEREQMKRGRQMRRARKQRAAEPHVSDARLAFRTSPQPVAPAVRL